MGTNVMCGFGAQRYTAIRAAGRGGRRERLWDFLLSVEQDRLVLPMGKDVQHVDLQRGMFCSIENGYVVPFRRDLGIAGLIHSVGDASGGYVVAVLVRAAFEAKIEGISNGTRRGAKVQARSDKDRMTQTFTIEATGDPFGELLFITDLEVSRGIIGFKPVTDERPFELAWPSRGLEERVRG